LKTELTRVLEVSEVAVSEAHATLATEVATCQERLGRELAAGELRAAGIREEGDRQLNALQGRLDAAVHALHQQQDERAREQAPATHLAQEEGREDAKAAAAAAAALTRVLIEDRDIERASKEKSFLASLTLQASLDEALARERDFQEEKLLEVLSTSSNAIHFNADACHRNAV